MQDMGFSWRFSQEYRSEEEIRHKELAYTAKWTWDYCAERPSHTLCPLALMDNDSMQTRLDFSVCWQLIYIPRTVLKSLFYTETHLNVTTVL